MLNDAMTDIYTIGGAGLAGSLLGLSTLSFAKKPERRLKNIVTGGALGIILGVAIVAYSQANKSQNLLTSRQSIPPPSLWSQVSHKSTNWNSANHIVFHFQF